MPRPETLEELEQRLREALARRNDLRFAILFGSCVTRGPQAARDVDIAIAAYEPISLLRLGALEIALDEIVGMEVDVIDIRKASSLLRAEVFRSGRVLHVTDEAWLRAFRGASRGSPTGR